ncbi:hypothetical protein Aab01nite_13150 [Paractinoplanes abujensis]|uniref:Uncharacterized protein n=1 Tax=Paractinoplanes abujensis TaxID=882441 RepID=A0A7W7FZS5_9ACTN|nr:hypothetical protein [Actinoplanes abujensis]MBB4690862.1 hypothetical protein [Actinoplanes abujensis]GID17725.1 hypothetical protein Aab01nite_13150 [Actinoplanes abujensis]
MSDTSNAGPSTDQHITGAPETDPFPTDNPPGSATPATGSSNKGVNATRANRGEDEAGAPVPEPPD